MADTDSPFLDLYSPDDLVAKDQATQLAKAIGQRRALGVLGTISGDPALSEMGKQFSGEGDALEKELMGAGQHRASDILQSKHLDIQGQQMANMQRHQLAMEAIRSYGLKNLVDRGMYKWD